jgi:hypothetical protein
MTDGEYRIEYQKRSLWLKFRQGEKGWRWYDAFDDNTLDHLNSSQLAKRLPCAKKMLALNAASPASHTPDEHKTPSAESPSQNESASWGTIVFVAIIVALLGVYRFRPRPRPAGSVKCPKCGSDQIHAGKRGWRLTTGFICSGKVIITCLRCGERFRPGKAA